MELPPHYDKPFVAVTYLLEEKHGVRAIATQALGTGPVPAVHDVVFFEMGQGKPRYRIRKRVWNVHLQMVMLIVSPVP